MDKDKARGRGQTKQRVHKICRSSVGSFTEVQALQWDADHIAVLNLAIGVIIQAAECTVLQDLN